MSGVSSSGCDPSTQTVELCHHQALCFAITFPGRIHRCLSSGGAQRLSPTAGTPNKDVSCRPGLQSGQMNRSWWVGVARLKEVEKGIPGYGNDMCKVTEAESILVY